MATLTADEQYKFWNRVEVRGSNDCWLWTGYRDRQGYGRFNVNKKALRAHVLSWELAKEAEWPSDKIAMHTCDVSSCVNPRHIKPGTHAENMRDKIARGRDRGPTAENRVKTHCKHGHPLSGHNLMFDGRGGRQCRECGRGHSLAGYYKAKARKAEGVQA